MTKTNTPGVDVEELEEFLASAPEGLQDWAAQQRVALSSPPAAKPVKTSTARGINKVLVALLAAAIVLLVQQWGQPDPAAESATPALGSTAGQGGEVFPGIDEERVAELEAELEADPDDVEALRELATLNNDAGMWSEAADYHQRVLALEPDDVDTLLALGVIQFNTGDSGAAEQSWLRATETAPDLPEPWFNLGFAYLGMEPADTDKAVAAWERLIEVAPDSQLARTAQSHIDGISGG